MKHRKRDVDMATLEQVEKLKERAAVSYDEARAALEACNDDLLDALIYLEKQGKVSAPASGGYYSSGARQQENENCRYDAQRSPKGESAGQTMRRFFGWAGRVLHKGNTNMFQVRRDEKLIMSIPITVLVLLLCFCFWIVLPLLIVGLFFDYRYQFVGAEIEKIDVNKVMDSAANAADNIKHDITGSGDK